MKLRFDIWQHIGNIDILVFDPAAKIVRSNWHTTWAFFFRMLGINDIFTYATIIHRVQFLLIGIIIYYAAKLLFSALLPTIELGDSNKNNRKQWLSSLALSSVLVWFTVIGTVSTFQQAWIMWYSVNYQITLPLLFLALGLFVNAVSFAQSNNLIVIKLFSSLLLLALIYLYHAGELAYLVFYMPIILVCFCTKTNYKKTLILMAIIFIVVFVAAGFYTDIMPGLVTLLKDENYHVIINQINIRGAWNTEGNNRYFANWNEMYTISVFVAAPVALLAWTKRNHVNQRVFLFIILSLAFCFIPTFKYSAGIASLISYDGIVNRYYFASFVFVLVPLSLYLVVCHFKFLQHPVALILIVLVFMGLVFSYSKLFNDGGVYYKNLMSIRNSLYQDRVGLDMPVSEIESIGRQIRVAETQYGADQIMFCANYDKSHIVRYIYRKNNILFDRNPLHTLDDCRDYAKSKNKLVIVIN